MDQYDKSKIDNAHHLMGSFLWDYYAGFEIKYVGINKSMWAVSR